MHDNLYSFYINHFCYITPDNKLFISRVENNVFVDTQVDIDVDVIESTIGMRLISNSIVLHTNTDDVYVCNFVDNTTKYLGKYFVTNIIWHGTTSCVFTVLITNCGIITFSENFIKISEYILPVDEVLEKINRIENMTTFFVCTSQKTYILNTDLVVVTHIDAKYIGIAKNSDFYYCVTTDGNVHICDENWKFMLCIDIMKITRIQSRGKLSFIDSDDVLYYLCDGNTDNKDNYSFSIGGKNYIVKHSMDGKNNSLYKAIIYNCAHPNRNECECRIRLDVTIFDTCIQAHYQSKDITYGVRIDNEIFNIEDISFSHLTNKNIMYLIDRCGKLCVGELKLENHELIFSKIDCELEIKIKKKINVKSAIKN